jgi:3-methyladenine DNA glycosylase AlkD
MTRDEVLAWIEREASPEVREGLRRYNIPTGNAKGIPMGRMQAFARGIGRDHALALALWETGGYEARTLAVFLAEPGRLTAAEADAWVADFDSWAICDTACFHLLDRTPFAWEKAPAWAAEEAEFVRRAGWALVWALAAHDRAAPDTAFLDALARLEAAAADSRPMVAKAVSMALRATGKRNAALRAAATATAERLAASGDRGAARVRREALRELAKARPRG